MIKPRGREKSKNRIRVTVTVPRCKSVSSDSKETKQTSSGDEKPACFDGFVMIAFGEFSLRKWKGGGYLSNYTVWSITFVHGLWSVFGPSDYCEERRSKG